jgi:ATP-dependent RNA helicase DHX36
VPREEAWTQYDGLGPVQQFSRDPARLDRNWRSGGPPPPGAHRGGGVSGSVRGNNHTRGGSPIQPASKRTKKMVSTSPSGRKVQSVRGGRGGSSRFEKESVDEAYLERNYPPIKMEDYPNLPRDLFSSPKNFLWENKNTTARSSFASLRGGIFQCTVFIKLSDGRKVEAIGDSQIKVFI